MDLKNRLYWEKLKEIKNTIEKEWLEERRRLGLEKQGRYSREEILEHDRIYDIVEEKILNEFSLRKDKYKNDYMELAYLICIEESKNDITCDPVKDLRNIDFEIRKLMEHSYRRGYSHGFSFGFNCDPSQFDEITKEILSWRHYLNELKGAPGSTGANLKMSWIREEDLK